MRVAAARSASEASCREPRPQELGVIAGLAVALAASLLVVCWQHAQLARVKRDEEVPRLAFLEEGEQVAAI